VRGGLCPQSLRNLRESNKETTAMASDLSGTAANEILLPIVTDEKISKAVKYYHLHREEILERRRLKKLEDPEYKARIEERLRKKAEREEAEAVRRAEKEAARATKEQKAKELQEKREAKRAAVLAAYEAQLHPSR
jgi:hypothetical protein